MKLLIAVLFVLAAAAVNSHVVLKKHHENSAEVEHALKPVVHPLEDGKHKLVHTGPDGKEVCTVCNPFAGGCGCSDIVAIRCELKRLKQKLGRLQKISEPHQIPHGYTAVIPAHILPPPPQHLGVDPAPLPHVKPVAPIPAPQPLPPVQHLHVDPAPQPHLEVHHLPVRAPVHAQHLYRGPVPVHHAPPARAHHP